MDAIILAGGQGSRMDSLLPKALVEINNKPLISYQLDYLMAFSEIGKIILALGCQAELIKKYITEQYGLAQIDFSVESIPLGTAGALKLALSKSQTEKILVLNCDDITDINVAELAKLNNNAICVAHPELPFGLVKEHQGYAVFWEKPKLEDWVSCGWYVLDKQQILPVIPEKGSLEYDVWPKIKLSLYKHLGFWQPLNTPKDINEFQRKLKNS